MRFCSARVPVESSMQRVFATLILACIALILSEAASAAGDDAATEHARALYRRGLQAYTEKHYDDALAAFVKVRELRPLDIEILRDLGAAEVRTGHMVEGAQYLLDWLRLSTKGGDKAREAVRELLQEAEQNVGILRITIDTPDAEVTVDERSIGTPPPVGTLSVAATSRSLDVYVTPGVHVARATRGEMHAEQSLTAPAGVVTAVTLALQPLAPSRAAAAAASTRPQTVESARTSGRSTRPASPAATSAPEQPLALRERHASMLLFGGGIALAGAELGMILLRSASRADVDADQLDSLVRAHSSCGDRCGESGYARDVRTEAQRNRTVAIASLSTAGVAALGTAAYFLWVPEPDDGSSSTRPIVAGTIVALTGVATGIVSLVQAKDDHNASKLAMDALDQRGLGDHGCLPGTDSVSLCAALLKSTRDYDEHRALGIAGFALAGAAALGTTAYLVWPRSSSSSPGVQATIGLDGRSRMLVVFGSF